MLTGILLRNIYRADIPRYSIKHNEVGINLHFYELILTTMEIGHTNIVFQLAKAGLNVPAKMIQLFQIGRRELKARQVRNQNLPFFFIAVIGAIHRVIDIELHGTAFDVTIVLEIPFSPISIRRYRFFILLFGLVYLMVDDSTLSAIQIFGVGSRHMEYYITVTLLIEQGRNLLDYILPIDTHTNDVIAVLYAVHCLYKIEALVTSIHNNDEWLVVREFLNHLQGGTTLI